jgi:hypothetical protein
MGSFTGNLVSEEEGYRVKLLDPVLDKLRAKTALSWAPF